MHIYEHDLGFWIYKEVDWEKLYLSSDGTWTKNKKYARTFYHKIDATSALVLIRIHDRKKSD